MKKKKDIEIPMTPDERAAGLIERFMREDSRYLSSPSRKFEIGEQVIVGALQNVIVTHVGPDNMCYVVEYDSLDRERETVGRTVNVWAWSEILPMSSAKTESNFATKDDIRITFYQQSVDSLIHRVHNQGVDFTPEYQRDYVWSLSDKEFLIESIFNNIDIGKFTFYVRSFEEESVKGMFRNEIIDGKQRLSTLVEFYEDKFPYKGKYYSQLGFHDRHHFLQNPVTLGETHNLTREQKIKLFLKLNTSGKVMSEEHLAKVRKLIA